MSGQCLGRLSHDGRVLPSWDQPTLDFDPATVPRIRRTQPMLDTGRDYSKVSLLHGMILGGWSHPMYVAVNQLAL